MQIQWFPGHMHKARKEIGAALSRVDLVIELLDARIPFSSENPMLAEMRGDKPCLKVMTKSDLSDPHIVSTWQEYFQQQFGTTAVPVSTEQPKSIRSLPAISRKIFSQSGRTRQRMTMMVVGIPNVGKSSLINELAGRAIAKTGNEPAVTRHQQHIELDQDLVLLDTPGVLWPNVENRNSGFRLAATGAIRDTAMSHTDVAFFLAGFLIGAYPENLAQRFELDNVPSSEHALFEVIGQKRGCLAAGGRVDMDRVSKLFVTEFRDGKLGRICLETPPMMEQELAEVELIRQHKAAKKRARKEKWKKNKK
jgi:ribosome biogenesis GTPase A